MSGGAVIDALQQCQSIEEVGSLILPAFVGKLGASGASFRHVHRRTEAEFVLLHEGFWGLSARARELHRKAFEQIDPLTDIVRQPCGAAEIFRPRERLDYRVIDRIDDYHAWRRADGFSRAVTFRIAVGDRDRFLFGFHRRDVEPDFTDEQIETTRDHVVSLYRMLGYLQCQEEVREAHSALDALAESKIGTPSLILNGLLEPLYCSAELSPVVANLTRTEPERSRLRAAADKALRVIDTPIQKPILLDVAGTMLRVMPVRGGRLLHLTPVAAPDGEDGIASRLTPRERQIARYVAQGACNKEISRRLDLSVYTVENHLRSIFAKVGVRSRTRVAVWAIRYLSNA